MGCWLFYSKTCYTRDLYCSHWLLDIEVICLTLKPWGCLWGGGHKRGLPRMWCLLSPWFIKLLIDMKNIRCMEEYIQVRQL